MRAFVFTDKALASEAGRVVWLSIDSEKPENAPFRKQFAVPALPTFLVVDPQTGQAVVRWVGSMTPAQVRGVLDAGEAHIRGGLQGADAALARADELYAGSKDAEAVAAYREALAQAPASWPQYARATESLLFALSTSGDNEGVVKLAQEAYPRLAKTVSASNLAGSGLDAAMQLPAEHPQRAAWLQEFEQKTRENVEDPPAGLAADDMSGLIALLAAAREDAKDSLGVRNWTAKRAAYLDAAAAKAGSPEGRTVFDAHRLVAYIDLGEPQKAIPFLEQSERDFPQDYNPPARLALAYKAMKRWDSALEASNRAVARVYGPRRITVLSARADIYKGKGDMAMVKKTLQDALTFAEGLPPGQRNESTIASLKKKVDAVTVQ